MYISKLYMKNFKLLFVLFLTLATVSCSYTPKHKPVYFEFKNDLEKDHLFGNVKSVTEFKANFLETDEDLTEKPILSSLVEYTPFGKTSLKQTYSSFGVLDKEERYEYNNKQLNTLSLLITNTTSDTVVQQNEFDANDNLITTIMKHQNKPLISHMEYDKNRNIIKQITFENGDTLKTNISYIYSKSEKIEQEIKKITHKNLTNQTTTDKIYNSNNHLLSILSKSKEDGEIKTVLEYDDAVLENVSNFKNGQLTSETEYNKYFNAESYKTYINNTLDGEFEYSYEFDKSNNWISKTVSFKRSNEKGSKFTKLFKLTRTIEYCQ